MVIRVIGGEFAGRKLQAVSGLGTRPLLGRVREAIFNILAGELVDAVVWDLFAGTGASGIEALSRGAKQVVFVERGRAALEVLSNNLAALGLSEPRAIVLARDAWKPPVLVGGEQAPSPDLVFLDPPYAAVAQSPADTLSAVRQLLAGSNPDACVVFHFQAGRVHTPDLEDLGRVDLRTWGDCAVAFVRPG